MIGAKTVCFGNLAQILSFNIREPFNIIYAINVFWISKNIIVVSQFTLLGDVKRGLRPYFGDAAPPEKARDYYEKFMALLGESGISIKGGVLELTCMWIF